MMSKDNRHQQNRYQEFGDEYSDSENADKGSQWNKQGRRSEYELQAKRDSSRKAKQKSKYSAFDH